LHREPRRSKVGGVKTKKKKIQGKQGSEEKKTTTLNNGEHMILRNREMELSLGGQKERRKKSDCSKEKKWAKAAQLLENVFTNGDPVDPQKPARRS